ncbi:MAG: DUF294 nucleotidyltransferase-like domain-containing protein [Bacteroidota bacterium]
MPSNTIQLRVYEFLKANPPFSYCPVELVKDLAGHTIIQYFSPDELIFEEGKPAGTHFFIVQQGAVNLLRQDELIDCCGEGDVFGVRSLITQQKYALRAKAKEETLLYGIPAEVFRPALTEYPEVALFFAARLARQTGQATPKADETAFTVSGASSSYSLPLQQSLPSAQFQQLLTGTPETSLQEAAQQMADWRVGSLVITNTEQHPIGILTDTDLRDWVATGRLPLSAPAEKVMSQPVVTAGQEQSVADVLVKMMQHDVHHICLTQDGSCNSPAVGMVTNHDLLLLQENNPVVILRKMQRAPDVQTLANFRNQAEVMVEQYIDQGMAIRTLTSLIAVMNDALTAKCVNWAVASLADEGFNKPSVEFCWLSLGSEGREEQLRRTDQDNALVFEDPPEKDIDVTFTYFQQLTDRVTNMLVECGWERCPANMMASNPQWCLSLSDWKNQFSAWIQVPDTEALLHAAIFFDFRAIVGNAQLAETLRNHIFDQIEAQSLFMHYMANNSLLNPPPLSFFRKFMVEKSGEHKDSFDIKRRAMMPLTDAARILAYQANVRSTTNTQQRLEQVATTDVVHATLFHEAAGAYDKLIEIRAQEGARQNNSGRYVDPAALGHLERELLRSIFGVIRDVQQVLRSRFQLDYFRR